MTDESYSNIHEYQCGGSASAERVLVILDVGNVNKVGIATDGGAEVDYSQFLRLVLGGRSLAGAFAVDGLVTDGVGRDVSLGLHRSLESAGFCNVLVRPSNGMGKQEGVDVKAVAIAVKYASKGLCDVVELVTGDGDFAATLDEIQTGGVKVTVTSFEGRLSECLRHEADGLRLIDDMPIVRIRPHAVQGVS